MFRVFDKRSLKIEIQENCSLRCETKKVNAFRWNQIKTISSVPHQTNHMHLLIHKATRDNQDKNTPQNHRSKVNCGNERTNSTRAKRREKKKTKKHDPRDCVFSLLNTSILKRFNAAAAPHRLILRGWKSTHISSCCCCCT